MKIKLAVLTAAIALSGCSARVQDIPTGFGKGYLVECNGAFSGWGKCYRKADEICKGKSFTVDNAQAVARTFGGAFLFGSAQERSMVVQCVDEEFEVEESFVK